ncbi:carboxymuconolactone decarboxylase family protein [Cryptosporangium phraense]|uniref:Carboxymuconolactone decarboxylase family protein n=1 Tax=Cryptosporangium phraense TaxID=2593070 RepID=A0A545ASA5_9ACTN|nr:carboxymuconolactone decarboxylase family protein [Cryptosporangium phraense]TQS44216.1 carboxymuconolactone decarboxylase family protein [Cryptosporangium phraense]
MLAPLEPPYPPDVARFLEKWMPPGFDAPPLALFRLFAVHQELCDRVRPMASGLLNHGLLPAADRELLILRTTAALGAEYEWGIHAVVQAPAAGVGEAALHATVHGSPDDFDDPPLIRAADELLAGSLTAATVTALARTPEQIIEIVLVVGWYRTLSTLIRTADLALEEWAARFPRPVGPRMAR